MLRWTGENINYDLSEPFLMHPVFLLRREETIKVYSSSEKLLNEINARIEHRGFKVQYIELYSEKISTLKPATRSDKENIMKEVGHILRRSYTKIDHVKFSSKSFILCGYYLKTVPIRYYKIFLKNCNAPKKLNGVFPSRRKEVHMKLCRAGMEDTEGGTRVEETHRAYVKTAMELVFRRLLPMMHDEPLDNAEFEDFVDLFVRSMG